MNAYTYVIGWTALGKFYYGVRYAKNCHPSDLFTTYFTSSKHVKQFMGLHGAPDLIQIRKTFLTKDAALKWESKVLRRLNVLRDTKWLNKTNNKAISHELCGWAKGQTYEQIYGTEKAKELKAIRSNNRRNRQIKWTEQSKSNRSSRYSGSGNPKSLKLQVIVDGQNYVFGCRDDAGKFLANHFNVKLNTGIKVLENIHQNKVPNFGQIFPIEKRTQIQSIYERIEVRPI